MPLPSDNNLSRRYNEGRLCKALGLRMVHSVEILEVAKAVGYDCIFIDLEHSPFSLQQATQLCQAANLGGISPLARIPHECGSGYVQRILDVNVKAIVVPHIRDAVDAQKAVETVKYPPLGTRSLNPASLSSLKGVTGRKESQKIIAAAEAVCILQIETREALENLDSIAATPGVDMLLVGSIDVTWELGILADWDNCVYQDVLRKVSAAARKHGKLWGIAGLFNRPDLWTWAVRDLGVDLIVGSLDIVLLAEGAKANMDSLCDAELKARKGAGSNGTAKVNGFKS